VAELGAVLDACVLYPAALRDTLYRPLWSADILAELERSLVQSGRIEVAPARRLVAAIRRAFEDAEVDGYEHLIDSIAISTSDCHVAAAAIVGGARVIVTLNVRDFPSLGLAPYQIEVQSPDLFLQRLLALDPDTMIRVIEEQAADLVNPPLTVNDVLDELAIFAPEFVALLRSLRELQSAAEET